MNTHVGAVCRARRRVDDEDIRRIIRRTVQLAVGTSSDAMPFGGVRQINTHVGALCRPRHRIDDEDIPRIIRRTIELTVWTSGDAIPFVAARQIQPKRLKPGGSHAPTPSTSGTACQPESNA